MICPIGLQGRADMWIIKLLSIIVHFCVLKEISRNPGAKFLIIHLLFVNYLFPPFITNILKMPLTVQACNSWSLFYSAIASLADFHNVSLDHQKVGSAYKSYITLLNDIRGNRHAISTDEAPRKFCSRIWMS